MKTRALLLLALASAGASGLHGQAESRLYTRVGNGAVRAVLEIELAEGWHLYHTELGHPEAIGLPTSVAFGGQGIAWSAPVFPEPRRFGQGLEDSRGDELWILGHEGLVRVYAIGVLSPPATGADAAAEIEGQVCQQSCIPYFVTVQTAGPGPDAAFAGFPAGLVNAGRSATPAPSQDAAGDPGSAPAQDVHLRGEADATLYSRIDGETARAAIEVVITPGWHLFHDDIGSGSQFAKPSTVRLGGEGIEWGPVRFPAPKRLDLGIEDEWAYGHEGTIVLRAEGRIAPGAGVGPISAEIVGQTCSEGLCVEYEETLASRGRGPDALFAAAPVAPGDTGGADGAGSSGTRQGLARFLLLAVLGGLFALVMPCTYPMIPITISFFTKQAERRGGGSRSLALAYGAGIVLVFVVIGVVFGSLIIPFATHPVTNLVIGLAFLYFAFVLFGLAKLEPPRFLMNAAGQASQKGGYLGVFLMGTTLVVTSFTCTAPFVGSLLSVGAADGDVGRIALGMAVFGLTMALPFVALSLVPGRLKALPRSGEWMNTLKHFLGFVEVAAALKFLSNADIVWGARILSRELFLFLWGVLFLLAALYLLGVFGRRQRPGITRLTSGAAALLFALYCFWGMQGAPLDKVMTAIAPNYSGGRLTPAWYHAGEDWQIVRDDYEAALARAKEEQKLLLVNFTGHSCVNCRLNELHVFPKRGVASVLREHFVEARLHTDDLDAQVRSRNRALQEEFARSVATPFYLVRDPETNEPVGGTVAGVTTVKAFREFLLDAVEESKDRVGRR